MRRFYRRPPKRLMNSQSNTQSSQNANNQMLNEQMDLNPNNNFNSQMINEQNLQSQMNNSNGQMTNQQYSQSQNSENLQNQTSNQNANQQTTISVPLHSTLKENVQYIKILLGKPEDLVIRELTIESFSNRQNGEAQSSQQDEQNQLSNQSSQQSSMTASLQQGSKESAQKNNQNSQCSILYMNGISDLELINNNILKMIQSSVIELHSNMIEQIYQSVIAITDTNKVNTIEQVIDALLAGNAVFFLDGEMIALEMNTSKFEKRALEEPQSESVIRGPRLALIEDIDTNISLIRKEIKDPNLRFDIHKIGRRSNQKVAVCYMNGVINPDIVNEVTRRLNTIDIDFTPDSGFIEQWLQDNFLSPFPQLLDTERLDRVLYGVLQGKVAILVDGSPFALLAPVSLGDAIQSIEDFNQRWVVGTLIRLLRILAIFIAVFLPSLYVALVSYHPGMLPTQLTFSIAATREGVPFPSVVEVLLMAITFEILQEAGIRLPKAIGQTVGIVGGIVIGDVAVSAGIVGPSLVIVTSLTAIASFTIPNYSFAVSMRILRFSFVMGAAVLGLYGIILVFIIISIHLVNLKSIGIPYTGPFAPNFISDMKNILIRAPIMNLRKRPPFLEPEDIQKMNSGGSRNE